MLQIVIPDNKEKLERQIKALKGLIKRDNDKDKLIHVEALKTLQREYEAL